MDQVFIRPNRRQHGMFLLVGCVVLLGHAWLSEFRGTMALVELLLFAIMAPVFLWQLLDRRPRLIVDMRGLSGLRLGGDTIPWSQIRGVNVVRTGRLDNVCLDWVRPGQDVTVRTSILAADLELKAAEIVELVRRRASAQVELKSAGP
jgi:hypothetical protein